MSNNGTAGPLGHGIHCIDAGYIRPGLACLYLLHREDECAVIETGTSHSVPRLLSLINELGLDSAQVRYDDKLIELWLLEPPSANLPSIHFRHDGAANVAFADGHVESLTRHFKIEVPGPNFISPSQAALMDEKQLGYVVDGDVNDPATQDGLYDDE